MRCDCARDDENEPNTTALASWLECASLPSQQANTNACSTCRRRNPNEWRGMGSAAPEIMDRQRRAAHLIVRVVPLVAEEYRVRSECAPGGVLRTVCRQDGLRTSHAQRRRPPGLYRRRALRESLAELACSRCSAGAKKCANPISALPRLPRGLANLHHRLKAAHWATINISHHRLQLPGQFL